MLEQIAVVSMLVALTHAQVTKYGQCPVLTNATGICVENCANDGDCDGDQKCCSNGCGHVCMIPAVPTEAPVLPNNTNADLTYYSPYRKNTVNYEQFDLYADGIKGDLLTSIVFQTKGKNDAHILLKQDRTDFTSNVIEIVLGGWKNTKSVIRDRQQGSPKSKYNDHVLSESTYRYFWVSWSDGYIKVGKGSLVNVNTIMSWSGLSHSITDISISYGYGSDGYWILPNPVSCGLRTVPTYSGTMFTLPITRIGEIGYSWERCFQGALAYATCEGDFENGAKWGNFTIKDCEMIPTLDESTSTPALKYLSETVLNETNVIPVLNETVTLTVPEVNLTEADVIYIADSLYNVLQLDVINPTTLDLMYEIINNLLSSETRIIDEAQTINNAANRIIRAVEEITSGIVLFDDSTLRYVRPFIASEIRSQSGTGDLYIGVDLKKTPTTDIQNSSLLSVGMPSDVNASESDTVIYLTEQLVSGVVSKLTFQIYGKSDLFSTVNGRYKVNSKIAAAKLYQNGRQIINLGSEYVTSVFYPLEDTDGIVCGYWDYFANEDAGGWKTDGCKTNITIDRVICQCNHLTNFAVLIDLEAHTISDTDKLVLGIITKVGLSVSIVGQGLTILTFVLFKHLRSGRGHQVLVNLSAAMLCTSVIFLVGLERNESIVGCKIVAALLHYFILVSFMWMLVEGLLQYLRFVKVLGTYIPKFILKTAIPSWGIPLIPVIIVLAIDHDLYYAGKGYCWLAYDAMLYAFIIPVAVVIFINIIVFFMVLCNLLKRRNKGMQSNQSERKLALLHFQAALSILVILGLTWVFGFMALAGAKIVFHYLFAIFNAFQGFFIFIMFTAREKQIRKAWRKMCCKGSEYKPTSGVDSQPRKLHSGTNSTNMDSGFGKGHKKIGSDTGLTFNNTEFAISGSKC